MILAALVATRFVHFGALVLALGAALALLGSNSQNAAVQNLRRWARRALALSAGLALLTAVLLLGVTAANLAGAPSGAWDAAILTTILRETDFGAVWTWRMVAAALLPGLAIVAVKRSRRALDAAAAIVALGLLASLALTGHAAVESGAEGRVHRLADAVHLVAAGIWLGALPPFLFMLRLSASGDRSAARFAAERLVAFHAVGLAAVLALTATGLVNSWFLVRTPVNLLTTPYGLLLIAKLTLFAAMTALAVDNRLRLVPALSRAVADADDATDAVRRVRTSVRAEWLLGLLLLAAVAVLGAIEPASANAS